MNVLQYASDLHLELRTIDTIPIIEPINNLNKLKQNYLALCGDIGNPYIDTYKAFLDIHSKLYIHILIISGNHEYYSSKTKQYTIEDMDNKLYEIVKKYNNVTYLNMEKIIIGRTKFIGCTLWSDISSVSNIVENIMNDYKHIYIDNTGIPGRIITKYNDFVGRTIKTRLQPDKSQLNSSYVLSLHTKMKSWLQSELDKYYNSVTDKQKDVQKDVQKTKPRKYDDIIILTHHAPTFKMLDKSDMYSPCYGTNCEQMMKPPVKYWISGHTHTSKTIDINTTICISNCMGYPGQHDTGYDPSKYITFN